MNHAARAFATIVFFIITLAASTALADSLTFSGVNDISTQASDPSGAIVTFSITALDASSTPFAVTCTPPSGSLFPVGTTTVSCEAADDTGATSTTNFDVGVFTSATNTSDIAHIAIRDGSTLIGPIAVTLPAVDAPDVSLTATGDTTDHAIPARSVLALLSSLDAANGEFEITDLQYFASFNSFLINCISVPAVSISPDCYAWTYAVNGSFPGIGMDLTPLGAGDSAYIFFGDAWQITTDKFAASTGETVTVAAQTYDAASGTYIPAPGEVVGAVQFDSNFMATEFATSTTGTNGKATLSLSNAGSYSVGAQATGYFPNVTVTIASSTPPLDPLPDDTDDGGGGGHGDSTHQNFDTTAAVHYLTLKQLENGSYSSDMVTDWVAIGLASVKSSTALTEIKTYMQTASPKISSVTDAERHAMALEALGINPYSGTSVDYIAPIVAAFDGTQIGDSSLVNDDIFALLPLMHAGYSTSDSIIQKTVVFIIAQQKTNGSWGDADMTAAAIQVLETVNTLPNVDAALTSAENYLHTQQQSNGGFIGASGVNSFSTSWALQAIAALGQSASSWTPGSDAPEEYLAGLQQFDGGVDIVSTPEAMRIWATAYAIPAAQNKTWDDLLASFKKPSGITNPAVNSSQNATTTSNIASNATTTPAVSDAATTTPLVLGAATSTLSITPPTLKPIAPVKPKTIVTTTKTKQPTAPTIAATPTPETNPQSQTVATVSTQDKPNFFVRIWNFLKRLFGLL